MTPEDSPKRKMRLTSYNIAQSHGQRLVAQKYNEYTHFSYFAQRDAQPDLWDQSYNHIREIIAKDVLSFRDQIRSISIEFSGICGRDFLDGCAPLHQKIDMNQELGEVLMKAKDIVLYDISDQSLNSAVDRIQEYCEKKNIDSSSIHLAQHDVTRGLVAVLAESAISTSGGNEDVLSVQNTIEEILQAFSSIFHSQKRLVPNGKLQEEAYPHVRYGYALNFWTATLVPLQEWLYKVLNQEAKKYQYDAEQRQEQEEKIFGFVAEFNDWLMGFGVNNWFAKNPNGVLTLFMDIDRQYYMCHGDEFSEEPDETRSYQVLSKNFMKKLKTQGYLVNELDRWKWRGEKDHFHPNVVTVRIQKKNDIPNDLSE